MTKLTHMYCVRPKELSQCGPITIIGCEMRYLILNLTACFFLKMLSGYYDFCINLNVLLTSFIMKANTLNPDQTGSSVAPRL